VIVTVTVGLGARRAGQPFRRRSVRVSSVVFTVAWVLALVAFVLMSMQLPEGTEPNQAATQGSTG
jgi:hypothetical protein